MLNKLLKKKHNSICFHRVREFVAGGVLVVHKVDTNFNLTDILTKSLPVSKKKELRGQIMFKSSDYFKFVND